MYLTTDILYPTLHLSSKWRIPVTLAILIFADFILILLQYMSKGYIIWFSSFIFFTVYNKRTEWGSCSSWNWKKKAFCPLLLLPAWLLTQQLVIEATFGKTQGGCPHMDLPRRERPGAKGSIPKSCTHSDGELNWKVSPSNCHSILYISWNSMTFIY